MIRFKRSEYDSVLKADSPYGGDDKPTPMFTDTDTNSLVMWSGKHDIPEVGDKVAMDTPVRYEGIVKEHFISAGYVGVKVLPYPWYHEGISKVGYGNLPKEGEPWTMVDLVHNFGCDVVEQGTSVSSLNGTPIWEKPTV